MTFGSNLNRLVSQIFNLIILPCSAFRNSYPTAAGDRFSAYSIAETKEASVLLQLKQLNSHEESLSLRPKLDLYTGSLAISECGVVEEWLMGWCSSPLFLDCLLDSAPSPSLLNL
jgi:hypothetical protein